MYVTFPGQIIASSECRGSVVCECDNSWPNSCFPYVSRDDLRSMVVTFPGQILLPLGVEG